MKPHHCNQDLLLPEAYTTGSCSFSGVHQQQIWIFNIIQAPRKVPFKLSVCFFQFYFVHNRFQLTCLIIATSREQLDLKQAPYCPGTKAATRHPISPSHTRSGKGDRDRGEKSKFKYQLPLNPIQSPIYYRSPSGAKICNFLSKQNI